LRAATARGNTAASLHNKDLPMTALVQAPERHRIRRVEAERDRTEFHMPASAGRQVG
jgi:hypothetical protein